MATVEWTGVTAAVNPADVPPTAAGTAGRTVGGGDAGTTDASDEREAEHAGCHQCAARREPGTASVRRAGGPGVDVGPVTKAS